MSIEVMKLAYLPPTGVPENACYAPPAQQEPVAWMFEDDKDNGHKTFQQSPPSPEAVAYLAKWNRPAWVPLYTAPPQLEWQGLTDEEIIDMYNEPRSDAEMIAFGREVEAKLKEKNK